MSNLNDFGKNSDILCFSEPTFQPVGQPKTALFLNENTKIRLRGVLFLITFDFEPKEINSQMYI